MKFRFADPPYLGCSHLYDHPDASIWDRPERHDQLLRAIGSGVDGWAYCLSASSLPTLIKYLPEGARVGAWVKPFSSFKPNVTRAYTWEPVFLWGGRDIRRDQDTVKDHCISSITLQKGLVGAKPIQFCEWILDWWSVEPGDELDDMFPGTGIMTDVFRIRTETNQAEFDLTAVEL